MGETGQAKKCWNYNLGNLKYNDSQRKIHMHVYFPGTWEYYEANVAAGILSRNKNTRYATPKEIVEKVGTESGGKRVIFYKPPDISTCYQAYKTLWDGVVGLTAYYKSKLSKHPDLLSKLNNGDCSGVAYILHQERYYTQDEGKYTRSMIKNKASLDGRLYK